MISMSCGLNCRLTRQALTEYRRSLPCKLFRRLQLPPPGQFDTGGNLAPCHRTLAMQGHFNDFDNVRFELPANDNGTLGGDPPDDILGCQPTGADRISSKLPV